GPGIAFAHRSGSQRRVPARSRATGARQARQGRRGPGCQSPQAVDDRFAGSDRRDQAAAVAAARATARYARLCARRWSRQIDLRLSLRTDPHAPGRLGEAVALAQEAVTLPNAGGNDET